MVHRMFIDAKKDKDRTNNNKSPGTEIMVVPIQRHRPIKRRRSNDCGLNAPTPIPPKPSTQRSTDLVIK